MTVGNVVGDEESVYRLIPVEEATAVKKTMYRSNHNPNVPPSYSTFGTSGTTKRLGNPSGATVDEIGAGTGQHKAKKSFSSIGQTVGTDVNPSNFMKKTAVQLPEAHKFERSTSEKRPGVPKSTEKPVMGLTTDKNFVVSNAVDAILAPPKNTGPKEVKMTQKRGYGSAPGYLKTVKRELEKEKTLKADAQAAAAAPSDPHLRLLSDEERRGLLASLKSKWHKLNQSYQSLTFSMDTVTKVGRKETQEAELDRLEKAMNKISSKKCVFVYDDMNVGFNALGIVGCEPKLAATM